MSWAVSYMRSYWPLKLCAADASLAPQMMVLVDAHVTLGRTLEFDARRSSRDLIDIEAARLFHGELPQPRPQNRRPGSRRR